MTGPLGAAELDADDDTLADRFRDADVVLLGEVHDNAEHHILQARLTAALQPSAIVFEMIEPGQARGITPRLRKDAVALEAHLAWEDRGWPDFSMYFPLFFMSHRAAIFGGALPRDDVRRAVSESGAAVLGDAATLFGLDQALPADQQETRNALQQAAHCNALPENILPGMVEAQRLRDAALARAVVNALAQNNDGPVVVIAGNGHIREDWGIPHALRHYAEATGESLTIATLAQYEVEAPDTPPVTHWVVTSAAPRSDPCEGFK